MENMSKYSAKVTLQPHCKCFNQTNYRDSLFTVLCTFCLLKKQLCDLIRSRAGCDGAHTVHFTIHSPLQLKMNWPNLIALIEIIIVEVTVTRICVSLLKTNKRKYRVSLCPTVNP